MMKRLYPIILTMPLMFVSVLHSTIARADFWGGDLPLLAQILGQTIQEVAQLQQAIELAQGQSDLLKEVNRDIQTALSDINALQDIVRDTTQIGKIKDPNVILDQLRGIFSRLPRVGNLETYKFIDQVSANSLGTDDDTHVHAKRIDDAADLLQSRIKGASPGRAQQLSAQVGTTSLHALAQIERSTATTVRVEATALSLENQREKDRAEAFDQGYSAMISQNSMPLDLGGLD